MHSLPLLARHTFAFISKFKKSSKLFIYQICDINYFPVIFIINFNEHLVDDITRLRLRCWYFLLSLTLCTLEDTLQDSRLSVTAISVSKLCDLRHMQWGTCRWAHDVLKPFRVAAERKALSGVVAGWRRFCYALSICKKATILWCFSMTSIVTSH